MHGEFLLVDNGKMAKSLGNVYTIADLEKKGFDAIDYRYFCLNSNYRTPLNFTFKGLESAKIGLNRLRKNIKIHSLSNGEVSKEEIQKYKDMFMDAMNDDLDSAKALSIIWEIARKENKSKKYSDLISQLDEIMGLDISLEKIKIREEKEKNIIKKSLNCDIENLIAKREEARKNKQWQKADEIREELLKKGIVIQDTKEGVKIDYIKK